MKLYLGGIVWVCAAGLCLAPARADILPVTQDAYVHGLEPGTNYGDEPEVLVRSWGPSNAFLQFDVSSVSGSTVDSATLLLDTLLVKKAGTVEVRLVDSAWLENTVTYNTQPGFSALVTSFPIITGDAGDKVSVDVTSIVQGWADGTTANYGIALTSNSINVRLGSKEGGAPATLDVTRDGGGPPPGGQQALRVFVTDELDLREDYNIAPGETTEPYWTACDPSLDYDAYVYVTGGGGEIVEEYPPDPPGKMVLVESKPHHSSTGSIDGWVVTYLNQSDTVVEEFYWRTWVSCLITTLPPEPE